MILYLYTDFLDIGVPVCVIDLDKAGSSNSEERIEFFDKYYQNLQKALDLYKHRFDLNFILLGDREFIGDDWLNYLEEQGITYIIRCRKDMKIGKDKIYRLVRDDMIVERSHNNKRYIIKKIEGDILALCTNDIGSNVEEICESYRYRWEIEDAIRDLKSDGFNLEETRITISNRLENLLYVIFYGYFASVVFGRMVLMVDKVLRGRKSDFLTGIRILSGIILGFVSYKIYLFILNMFRRTYREIWEILSYISVNLRQNVGVV